MVQPPAAGDSSTRTGEGTPDQLVAGTSATDSAGAASTLTQSVVPQAQVAAAVASGVPEPFRFSDDAVGRLQSERLAPSKVVPLDDVPRVAQPLSPRDGGADRLPVRTGPAVPDVLPSDPRVLPSEQTRIVRFLPTFDRPPLPLFSLALVPQEPEFSTVPRTRIAAAVPEGVPSLAETAAPYEVKPVVQDDPSAPSARRALLAPIAFADPVPAAPEKLTIPDPFEYLRPVKLQTPPVDAVAPSVSYERPGPIVLPVDK